MLEIKLTNSITRKKEIFVPLKPKEVKIYVCGITPYDYPHIGHGRCYVNFDVVVRLLKFIGYKVTYVRNFTDIDDKILNKAIAQGNINLYPQIAQKFIDSYHQDMQSLGNLVPDHEPRVTQYIPEIIKFIEKLIQHNKAYVIDGDVYFNILSFSKYGKLSGRALEEQYTGVRIEIDEKKRNPGDFALWKSNKENLFWKSPWGYGRPGWHIECSVMVKELLGQTIDIHGGGLDLIFPHHENEIAQSEGLHEVEFARYWIHNGLITVDKEKMSKSLGNFITLKDLFKQYHPIFLRYLILQHHYRSPLDFSYSELNASQTAYKKLVSHFNSKKSSFNKTELLKDELAKKIITAICDDLNTPKALGLIFENFSRIKNNQISNLAVQIIIQDILGLPLIPIEKKQIELTSEIKSLIKKREQARREKNWILADKIRNQLREMGYEVQDEKAES